MATVEKTVEVAIESYFLTLSPLTLVTQAIAAMAEARTSCAIIVENKQLLGIFTERDVVRAISYKLLLETLTLADLMTREVIRLKASEADNVFALSQLFTQHRIRHIPVLDEQNQVVGVITPQSIRNLVKPEYLLRYIRVIEVMIKKVIRGAPNDSILALTQRMALHRVSCIVIVNPESTPVGIITERDVVQFHALGLDFAQVSAESVMSTPLSAMQPQDSLWSVHQRMQQLRVRRLVITEPTGELAGIVTQTQMLKLLDPTEMYHVMQQMQAIIDQQTQELQQLNQKLAAANAELGRLVMVDELTQVVNRRCFNEFFAQAWHHLAHQKKSLSLILCDVDGFKAYNDTYGHPAGDECLVKIAQALREITRHSTDLVARYGGEEFAIVLPDTDKIGAERVAKAILTHIQQLQISHAASSTAGYITVSLGVATVIPDQSNSREILLQVADQMLYQSKQQGRNTYNLQVLATTLSEA